ncbi:PLP-dependent aminotransferase family protein [Paenibacillus sp. HWE-109]|uniref:MocR-like pyridoxine biosynthesis transcription factor PdxR n=1 Tax=Paenibacillus sp. HWE-109 TaxID=1306526 RepID=UPI001EDD4953|nr:PLP-dependent aminotransferase family protein [Paenibacillus sp. HWE-109]UKS25898.1 PLP-dependent aminotransferase family protein [Paenibacillus sp. HWE-109]
MFDILLSDQSHDPLYLQLYMQIRQQIRRGVITNGTRMPSVRSLQLQLNISKTPIETAYQMLSSEGYVRSKPRSGLYAINPYEYGHAAGPVAAEHNLAVNLRPAIQPATLPKANMDFNPTHLDASLFPLRIWKKMLHDAMENSAELLCQYGDPQGEYAFRAVIADYIRQARGVVCSPEQIVIGTGITYSIGILTKLLADVAHIAMEEPGFTKVREHFRLDGFALTPISVQDQGLCVEELEGSAAQAVYVTPSHQFPTGSVIPYAERERLLNWAITRNAYIIEDDYDGEFRYLGKPIPSLQSLDQHGRVIYIGTFSKAFTPALRMNYMVLPMPLVSEMERMNHLLASPSRIEQWAMQAFIEQGHWYRHIRRMRNMYRKKHDRLIELLSQHFADHIEITGHSAGLHIQVSVKTHVKAEQLVEMAAEQGVQIYDLHRTWMHQANRPIGYPKVYLGFGGLSETDMEKGIMLLLKAWSRLWRE